jgi:hypothetical protein
MPARPKRHLVISLAAASGFLLAPAPPQSSRLSYDPAVFVAGACLSPDLSGCGVASAALAGNRSASEALLDAGREPRLPLDLAGLIDMGPQVTGGGEPGETATSDVTARPLR